MKKEAKDLLPEDINTALEFMGSDFRNSETETISRNIVLIQKKINPLAWTPFSFEDYKKGCTHSVTSSEEGVIRALTHGGKPVFNTSANLTSGYLVQTADEKYQVTEKFLKVIAKFAKE